VTQHLLACLKHQNLVLLGEQAKLSFTQPDIPRTEVRSGGDFPEEDHIVDWSG
jgi:hypothetical protein